MNRIAEYYGAIVIGINEYSHNPKLDNAANDAKEIAEKLRGLKYTVFCLIDDEATYDKYVEVEENILGLLLDDKIQGVMLYFSGHGFMTDGKDCLVLSDAEDMRIHGGLTAMRKSIKLDEFYGNLRKRGAEKVIAIVDACRSDLSMYGDYDGKDKGVPINDVDFGRNTQMPYQTFLAFSTSPKTNAKDGVDGHSRYTKALLDEIETEHLQIEQLFKHVRKKVHLRDSDQIPWENSCLVDDFCFNYGQLDRHYGSIYDRNCFRSETDDVIRKEDDIIVESLLANGKENLIGRLSSIRKSMDHNMLFRIGRKLMQMINRRILDVRDILKYNKVGLFAEDGQNHLLNGLLYEFYFDSEDNILRPDGHDMQVLDELDRLCEHGGLDASVKFIRGELDSFRRELFYIPGDDIQKVYIDVEPLTDERTEDEYNVWLINYLSVEEEEVDSAAMEKSIMDNADLRNVIRDHCLIPLSKVKIRFSESVNQDDLFVLDRFNIADILNDYFVGNSISDMDDICHHYEYVGIDDCYIRNIVRDDGYLRVKGDFSIDVVVYLDSEEEIRTDECIDGTFDIVLENDMSKWTIAEIEAMTLDTSKYWM